MDNTFDIDDTVYFIHDRQICKSIVTQIRIGKRYSDHKKTIKYKIEDYEDHKGNDLELSEDECYIDIDSLLSGIKFDYEYKLKRKNDEQQ
jgi:hypothetical protein